MPSWARRSISSAARAIPATSEPASAAVVGHEREDRAVVIGVGVDVEHAGARGERLSDRGDHGGVAALRHVRHRLEHRHGPTLRRPPCAATAPSTRCIATWPSAASVSGPASRSSRCPSCRGRAGRRAYLFGQAPGIVEGAEGRPWRGRAGQTLRRWLRLDEEAFYATFYCASVTRCYPGRPASGRGDRTPTTTEQALCRRWHDEELRLLRPPLVVTVGLLAARSVARSRGADGVHRQELPAGRCDRDPAPPSLRRKRLAQRRGQPPSPGEGARPRPARARTPRGAMTGRRGGPRTPLVRRSPA